MMTSILYTDYFQLNDTGKERVTDLVKQKPVNPKVQVLLEGSSMSPIVSGKNAKLDKAIYEWQNKLRTDPK